MGSIWGVGLRLNQILVGYFLKLCTTIALAYITGRTNEALKKEREEVLSLSAEKIRQTAPLIEAVLKQNYICTVGNREKIMEAKDLFGEIRDIFQ